MKDRDVFYLQYFVVFWLSLYFDHERPYRHHCYLLRATVKSDGQEISTIEWQELKNEFRLFSDYKKLPSIEEIWCISFSSGAL